MTFNLNWVGHVPELTEDQTKKLAEELSIIDQTISDASELIFNLIYLTEDTNGPSVIVYGNPETKTDLFLEYEHETHMVPLDVEDLQEE